MLKRLVLYNFILLSFNVFAQSWELVRFGSSEIIDFPKVFFVAGQKVFITGYNPHGFVATPITFFRSAHINSMSVLRKFDREVFASKCGTKVAFISNFNPKFQKTITIHDANSLQILQNLVCQGEFLDLHFFKHGKFIAAHCREFLPSGDEKYFLKIFDTVSRRCLKEIEVTSEMRSFKISEDGSILTLKYSWDFEIVKLEFREDDTSCETISRKTINYPREFELNDVFVSGNGQTIVAHYLIWYLQGIVSGSAYTSFDRNGTNLSTVFSREPFNFGTKLIVSYDGLEFAINSRHTINFFRTHTGACVKDELDNQSLINHFDLSPCNDFVITVDENGIVKLWRTNFDRDHATSKRCHLPEPLAESLGAVALRAVA